MAFANEVRDFIDAFKVGATIKDQYKRRKNDEKEAEDRLTIAANKNKLETDKFNRIYDQNERKIKDNTTRWQSELDYKDRALTGLEDYREGSLGVQRDRAAASNRAAAERQKALKLKNDPASIVDEEGEVTEALPTQVTNSGAPPAAKEGIPTSEPAEKGKGKVGLGVITAGAGMGPATLPMALAGGLKYLNDHFGLGGGIQNQSSGQKNGAKRLFEGEGTMTKEEADAVDGILDEEDIKNGVDPKELTESMRTMRRLTRAYNMWTAKGNPEMANQMAASIIQSSRGIASMLGAQAVKKLQGGDLAGAAQDIVTAHDQIPDGRSVKFDPESMSFVISDEESGDVIEKGQVTPEMIFSLANGFKDGSAVYRVIMDAAKRDKSMENKKDPNAKDEDKELPTMAPDDFGSEGSVDQVSSSIQSELMKIQTPDGFNVFEGMQPEQVVEQIGEDSYAAINDLGASIAKYNSINPVQAGKLALSIVNPDLTNTEKPGWNFKLINGGKNVMEIMTEDGTRLKLPTRTASSMIKRGHDGLSAFALKLHNNIDEKQINSAIQQSGVDEVEAENAANMQKARDKDATNKFDRDVLESIHGPGGTEANTAVSALPITKRRQQRRLTRT